MINIEEAKKLSVADLKLRIFDLEEIVKVFTQDSGILRQILVERIKFENSQKLTNGIQKPKEEMEVPSLGVEAVKMEAV